MKHRIASAVLLVSAAVASFPAEAQQNPPSPANARFAAPPTVVKADGAMKVTFTVSAPTDVEVAIVDAAGRIVRHLAAGVLGGASAPPAPLKSGLDQELVWDGTDDDGKPVAGAAVRVRLGMAATFARVLGWSGQQIEDVRGLTCGPDGTLYVFYGGQLYAHRRTTLVAAFGRDGRYLRQLVPGPGGLTAEQRAAWPHVATADGREVPIIWHMEARSIVPGLWVADRTFPICSSDGRLRVIQSPDSGFAHVDEPDFRGGRRVSVFNTDGSVTVDPLGPIVASEQTAGYGWLAESPDGKWLYLTGFGGGKDDPLHNVVYRMPRDGDGRPTPWIGTLKQAGSGAKGLNDPQGMAVDAAGNLYVADHGNSRVAVFDAEGKFLKQIDVITPWQVLVSRRGGAIYVVAETGQKLAKFTSLANPTEAASLATNARPYPKIPNSTMLALDDSSEPANLWLVTRFWHSGTLRKLVDRGDKFEDLGDVIAAAGQQPGMDFTGGLAVAGGRLVTRNTDYGYNWSMRQLCFDAATGKYLGLWPDKLNLKANEVAGGKDDRIYSLGGGYQKPMPIDRFTPDGTAIPFAEDGSIKNAWHGHTRPWGLFITRAGEVYVPGGDGYRELDEATVRRFGPDGKLIDRQVVQSKSASLAGVAVDSKGNVYLGAQIVPKGQPLPDWFAGTLPGDDAGNHAAQAYRQIGSIIKFAPSGGAIVADVQGGYIARLTSNRTPVSLKNAEWIRRGGSVPSKGKLGVHCFCETSRFDVDEFDRLFVPDLHRFCVQVLDASGNPIALIGGYGNMDNRGPGSPRPTPAIAYGWPLATQIVGDELYVADVTNRRVVVAKLGGTVEAMAPIR